MSTAVYSQAQRLVLFEEFGSEDCPSCDSADPYVHALFKKCPAKVVGISYQSYIPNPGPLYYQDQSDDQTRMQYYGITSAPWGQQDGALWDSSLVNTTGNNSLSWCTSGAGLALDSNYLDTEYAKPAPFTISVNHNFTATTDSFFATVVTTGAGSYTVSATGKLALRVAMVEDLQFTTPPGTNGETDFVNVVRHMYPNASGTLLADSWVNGQAQTFTFSGPVPASIKDKTKVRFVAFIQDDNNQHVLQAGISAPFTFAVDAATQNIQGNFIQCTGNFTPVFTLLNKGSATITDCSFQINVDGINSSTQTWTGSIPASDSTLVSLSPVTLAEGLHTISVAAQNPNALTDGNSGNNTTTIHVGSTLTSPLIIPLVSGFETAAEDTGWLAESVSLLASGWSRQHTGYNSAYSYQMNFWAVPGSYVSNLYTPPFSTAGFLHVQIKFDRAYARDDFGNTGSGPNKFSDDSLYIEVSADCGNTWQNVYANGGSTMATAPEDSLQPFTPTQQQWVADSADISNVANLQSVILRFKAVSGNGNDLYIDNVNIQGYDALAIPTVSNEFGLNLNPNPATNSINVQFETGVQNVFYRILDITGQMVIAASADVKDSGQQNLTVNTSALANGLYLFNFTTGRENITRRFCVVH